MNPQQSPHLFKKKFLPPTSPQITNFKYKSRRFASPQYYYHRVPHPCLTLRSPHHQEILPPTNSPPNTKRNINQSKLIPVYWLFERLQCQSPRKFVTLVQSIYKFHCQHIAGDERRYVFRCLSKSNSFLQFNYMYTLFL